MGSPVHDLTIHSLSIAYAKGIDTTEQKQKQIRSKSRDQKQKTDVAFEGRKEWEGSKEPDQT